MFRWVELSCHRLIGNSHTTATQPRHRRSARSSHLRPRIANAGDTPHRGPQADSQGRSVGLCRSGAQPNPVTDRADAPAPPMEAAGGDLHPSTQSRTTQPPPRSDNKTTTRRGAAFSTSAAGRSHRTANPRDHAPDETVSAAHHQSGREALSPPHHKSTLFTTVYTHIYPYNPLCDPIVPPPTNQWVHHGESRVERGHLRGAPRVVGRSTTSIETTETFATPRRTGRHPRDDCPLTHRLCKSLCTFVRLFGERHLPR